MENVNVLPAYDRIMQIISDFSDTDFKKYYKDVTSKIAYEQYARGGESLPRGYYCPSLITDIIVGGVNRGKILKRRTSKKPTYRFGFDSDDKLIFAESPYSYEFISHKGQTEIGITVDKYMDIESISECQFKDGRIDSYVWCLYNPDTKFTDLTEEKYEYHEAHMYVNRTTFFLHKKTRIKGIEKYIFSVENGYLTSYKVHELDEHGNVKKLDDFKFKVNMDNSVYENRVFEVYKERKIY